MAGTKYQLTMGIGPNPGRVFPLEKAEIVIGRDATVDIVINDLEVSRKHAHFIAQQGGYLLEDLGSTNGTTVNDVRLTNPHLLLPGEMIGLGEHVNFVYEAVKFDPDATQVSIPVSPPRIPDRVAEPAPVQPASSSSSFSGQVPLNPVQSQAEVKKKRIPMWVILLIVVILFVICSCVVFLFVIDANSQWCTFFPFISGCP